MRYSNSQQALFVSRPNRFIAWVELAGQRVVCHVKNTGRCRELLLPGARVVLTRADNPARKTQYDLIAVYKGETLINIDSQAPNKVALEYIPTLFPRVSLIRPECPKGDSRLDFYVETEDGRKIYMEVKGVTLEREGAALFPDAPTLRGIKHLRELAACAAEGAEAWVLFIIQLRGVTHFSPNDETHKAFGEALRAAKAAGVRIAAIDSLVEENSLTPGRPVPVLL